MQDSQTPWVNNFWGQNDSGYHQLMQRMHDSRQTCSELKQYYRDRVQIEQEYTRQLLRLSRKPLGANETGDMKLALETVRTTTQNAAATHETVARQISEQLLSPLNSFNSSMKGRSKTIEDTMAQLTKAKNSQNTTSEKARNKYVNECNRISGYQASQNLLMGKELDRNNQKLDKATYEVEGLQRQYQDSLKALAQTMETWNAEWRNSCEKLERLEEERLTFMKSNLWAYANALSSACVADDEACENVRLALERCDPIRDLENFSKERGTGSRIQDPPEFVNFLQGFSRESEEDGHYHIANFNSSYDPQPLSQQAIPDLHAPSGSASTSRQLSPVSNQEQFSPVSSPGSSPLLDQYQASKHHNASFMTDYDSGFSSTPAPPTAAPAPTNVPAAFTASGAGGNTAAAAASKEEKVKKRKSWAMPFKKKQPIDEPTQFGSALDEPSNVSASNLMQPSSGFSVVSTSKAAENPRNKPWSPPSAPNAASRSQEKLTNGTAVTTPPSNEDPLLTALERLKTPGMAARPKSAYAPGPANTATAAPNPNRFSSPYGNGSPPRKAVGASQVEGAGGRKSPARKQVGAASGASAPMGGAARMGGAPAAAPKALPSLTTDGRRVIKHSRAQYDYRAAIPEEVTFRKGDLLLITEMQEDGWWDCEVANGSGAFGLAPSNFLADA